MKRREFLAAGIAVASGVLVRRVRAQPTGTTRAAVVIGVNKAGEFPTLRAATSGAKAVALWLGASGFDVKLFVDDTAPVKADAIFDEVKAYVDRGTLSQLVVYFAGHGCVNSYAEYWLLSGAPANPNQAVSLTESVVLAKQSGIPNVVFISDACRSTADSLQADRVRGNLIFPNQGNIPNVVPDVDQFLATVVGDPAWEVPVSQSTEGYEGLYTSCFLDAFAHPDDTMVRTVEGVRVVPNNKLKPYLAREVPKRAQQKSIALIQRPDTQVVSDDNTYIARVTGLEQSATGSTASTPTIRDLASAELRRAGVGDVTGPASAPTPAVERLASTTGFNASRDRIIQARGLTDEFDAPTGFVVSGASVEEATTNPRIAEALNAGPTRVGVNLKGVPAASVALRFSRGFGTVIGALNGFIGNIVVNERGVDNVSYIPSRWNPMRSIYEQEARRLNELHAVVATSARFGVFRIDGEKGVRENAARQLADRIRMLKGIDPTLGLYAAYAYADVGLVDQILSVKHHMRDSLHTDLFDVAMLSFSLGDSRFVPFCPMLSQGWSLLRVKNVRLPEDVGKARDHLRPALWTTFDDEGTRIMASSLRAESWK